MAPVPRSLFDGVDLTLLRSLIRERQGFAGLALTCLVEGGVLQYDPGDAQWEDRDRIVVAEAGLLAGAWNILPAAVRPESVPRGQAALAFALGLAEASRAQGGIFRVFCLLDHAALEAGTTWEAARAASANRTPGLAVLAEESPAAGVFSGAQWMSYRAPRDLVGVLAALDRALSYPDGPVAVTVAGS